MLEQDDKSTTGGQQQQQQGKEQQQPVKKYQYVMSPRELEAAAKEALTKKKS